MERCGRAHSPQPPFGGFDPRMVETNNISRHDHRPPGPPECFDEHNYENHSYELSPQPTTAGPHHMMSVGRNFEPPPGMHHQPPISYRDTQRLPSTYRVSLRGEPYPSGSSVSSPGTYKILCITNINPKIGDGTVKEALMSDFSRFGDIQVSTCHDSGERLAYIYFRSSEEAREARHARSRSILFDRPIEIEPIYESGTSPSDSPPQQQPMYPRRRSVTPPEYYGMNGRGITRGPGPGPMNQPPIQYHEPLSPGMYQSSRYGQTNAPPPMASGSNPYARSGAAYYPPLPHPMGLSHSQYSPPPMDHSFRSPYHHPHAPPPPPLTNIASPHMHQQEHGQYQAASSVVYDRNRQINDPSLPTRSPRNEYNHVDYMRDKSGIYATRTVRDPNYFPGSGARLSPSTRKSSPPSGPMPAQPEYPRHMSREYRREKFGREHYNIEPEEGRPSRVIFVTKIDSNKTEEDLRDVFAQFGTIEEIDIRNVNPDVTSALVRYSSMDCAYRAKTAMNGKPLGHSKCRISYGKVSATKRLWVGGFGPATKFAHLEDEFGKYGNITTMDYISGRPYAYVEYETANQAQFAVLHLKGTFAAHAERKLRMEYVEPTETNDKTQRYDSSLHSSDRSRITNDSWTGNEYESSLTGGTSSKRSASPLLGDSSKRSARTPGGGDHQSSSPTGHSLNETGHQSSLLSSYEGGSTSLVKDELNNNNKMIKSDDGIASQQIFNSHRNNTDRAETRKSLSSQNETNSSTTKEDFVVSPSDTSCGNEPALDSAHMSNIGSSRPTTIGGTPEFLDWGGLVKSTSIHDVIECCGLSWFARLVLKNFSFATSMFLCGGQRSTIERYITKLDGRKIQSDQGPLLRINQRWRLHPQPKLEEVKRRMQQGNVAMMIITSRSERDRLSIMSTPTKDLDGSDINPYNESSHKTQICENGASFGTNDLNTSTEIRQSTCGTKNEITDRSVESEDGNKGPNAHASQSSSSTIPSSISVEATQENSGTQPRPLKNLISYLEQKDAAGVVSLSPLDDPSEVANTSNQDGLGKLLYAFPPGEFAINLLKRRMPNLSSDVLCKEEFLLGVIVGGSDGKLM